MMIADVIRETTTEQEIYFLLTAYIEAVKYSGQTNNLPQGVTRLPLHRIDDVETRFEELTTELDMLSWSETDGGCLILREAADIFAAALSRLCSLGHRDYTRGTELAAELG